MRPLAVPTSSAPPLWSFYNPARLTVGRGCREGLLQEVHGQKLLVVASQRGRQQLLADPVLSALSNHSTLHWVDGITENPTLQDLQGWIDCLGNIHFDAVIGFGGGSALDAAKVFNLALNPHCHPHTLAQLIATPALHPQNNSRPLYALPTTAGTGSEVTPFATVWDRATKKKLSLTSNAVFPTAAYVDAALTDSLPRAATISTGLDAINQAAESVWNKNANPITQAYATRALKLGFAALPALAQGDDNPQWRDYMAEASVLAGLAISHTRTALCHSISYPLTAHFGVPHGFACAFTMPAVLQHNLAAEDGRFAELATLLFGSPYTQKLLERFQLLNAQLHVRDTIKTYIPSVEKLLELKSEMFTSSRADNNLAAVSDLDSILRNAWGQKMCCGE